MEFAGSVSDVVCAPSCWLFAVFSVAFFDVAVLVVGGFWGGVHGCVLLCLVSR